MPAIKQAEEESQNRSRFWFEAIRFAVMALLPAVGALTTMVIQLSRENAAHEAAMITHADLQDHEREMRREHQQTLMEIRRRLENIEQALRSK